ncbi:MAG: chemotaxis protein CheD [Planctomycetes bacterium]|nr:chemotaxis protein CheD [Planctomycetota bacterium]
MITTVKIGEIAIARDNGLLRTLLGSCLGVVLYDRRLRAAAMAHVVLPDSRGHQEHLGKFADTAIPEMIRRLEGLFVDQPLKLTAKIAGGANMFAVSGAAATIGEQNVSAVEKLLGERRILILGRHLGGTQGRRMALDVTTGAVTIDVVGVASANL